MKARLSLECLFDRSDLAPAPAGSWLALQLGIRGHRSPSADLRYSLLIHIEEGQSLRLDEGQYVDHVVEALSYTERLWVDPAQLCRVVVRKDGRRPVMVTRIVLKVRGAESIAPLRRREPDPLDPPCRFS